MSINGLPIENASVFEDNPKAKLLDDYITNILMMENEDAQGFLLNVVPIVLRINVFIVNIDTSANARVFYYLTLIEQYSYLKVQHSRVQGHIRGFSESLRQLKLPRSFSLCHKKRW